MLIEMKAPLQEGQIVPITLGFEDGSSKQVDAKVVNMMAGKSMPQPVQHGKH
jgi:copper(I)-binding protein